MSLTKGVLVAHLAKLWSYGLLLLARLIQKVLWNILIDLLLASPYLLSLGLSKSFMAVVLLAGPLSGLVMQPLVGRFKIGSLCALYMLTFLYFTL